MKSVFAIVFLVLALFVAEAKTKRVNLDRLSEKKRTEYLISKAKEVVMCYGPGYYREYAAPIIERELYDTSIHGGPKSFLKENANRENWYCYKVWYPYDRTKEIFWGKHSAKVFIWAETGEPFRVSFGNGWGIFLCEFTEEDVKQGRHVMHYDSTRYLLKYRKPMFKSIVID